MEIVGKLIKKREELEGQQHKLLDIINVVFKDVINLMAQKVV